MQFAKQNAPIDKPPTISVVIPTRNRGRKPIATLTSVLRNSPVDCEIILVDQSTNDDTERAVRENFDDQRLIYLRTDKVGAGWARHLGIQHARGRFVAMADDDCLVPKRWLETFLKLFQENDRVGLIFSSVTPLENNRSDGFTPNYNVDSDRLLRHSFDAWNGVGLGASMAMRRQAIIQIGNFDIHTGPGSIFRSGDDLDLALRLLRHNWWVLETGRTAVIHDGFRENSEYRRLSERDWYAAGGILGKHLKCGNWAVSLLTCNMVITQAIGAPASELLRLRPPRGARRIIYFSRGLIAALRTPVRRQPILFNPNPSVGE